MQWTPSYTNRWGTPKYRALSPLATYLYEYLQSNSETNFSGIRALSIPRVAIETKLSEQEVQRYLTECSTVHLRINSPLSTPLLKYKQGVIWIVGQWEHSHCTNTNYKIAVANEFLRSPNMPFWAQFFAQYPEIKTALERKECRYGRRDEFLARLKVINGRSERNSKPHKGKLIDPHTHPDIDIPVDIGIDGGMAYIQKEREEGRGGVPHPTPPLPFYTCNSDDENELPPPDDGPATQGPAAVGGESEHKQPTAQQLAATREGWGEPPNNEEREKIKETGKALREKLGIDPSRESKLRTTEDENERRAELKRQAEAVEKSGAETDDGLDGLLNGKDEA